MTTSTQQGTHFARYANDVQVGMEMDAFKRTPTEVQLFRYCAVTWNSHRIHYDRGWAEAEGYPDVLVQSHLHGAFLTSLCTEWMGPKGRLEVLSYSVRRFACPGDVLTLEGTVTGMDHGELGATVSLALREVRKADDTVCASGEAKVYLPFRDDQSRRSV